MIRQFLRLYLTIMVPVIVLVALVHRFGAQETSRRADIGGLSIALAVASITMLWLWFRPTWKALERLGIAIEQIAPSQGATGSFRGNATFGQPFATTIDRMSTRLADLLRVRRAQSNGVAHELTAPIAQLSFALEILKENPNAAGTPDLLVRMREDLQQLDLLVGEFLEYAKLGDGKALSLEAASVTGLIRGAADAACKFPAHGKQITFTALDGDADRVVCDTRQIDRALSNLLRNAVRHARTTIVVGAEKIGDTTWIHVDDDGEGVAEAHRERLFEPFTRIEDHTVGAARGYGLGLAIVQQIAELHGGSARIDRSPLGGARVTIGW